MNFANAQPAVMTREFIKRIPIAAWANALCKARLQEWRAASTLRRSRTLAKAHRIDCPTGEALEAALRRRLSSRSRGRWPKLKGELHLFLAYYVSNWEAILPTSLQPFGQVTAFNWRECSVDDRVGNWIENRERMNADMLAAFHAANEHQPVDAVIGYLSGHNTNPETLRDMAKAGAAVFNLCFDDKLYFPGRKLGGRFTSPAAIASAVDLNLTNAPESIVKYAVHGGLAMFWPGAAHPEVHRPHPERFDYEVSFVGSCYGWRPRFAAALRRHGIKVECFGNGWPNGSLSNEEVIRLYSRSRINLGFGAIGHSRKLLCLKGRDFEVPMSGGLYLTQHNPELALVYDIGREIVTYKNANDCAQQITELLGNPDRAAALREAGRKRALKEHTYEAKWSRVLETAGLLQKANDDEADWKEVRQ